MAIDTTRLTPAERERLDQAKLKRSDGGENIRDRQDFQQADREMSRERTRDEGRGNR